MLLKNEMLNCESFFISNTRMRGSTVIFTCGGVHIFQWGSMKWLWTVKAITSRGCHCRWPLGKQKSTLLINMIQICISSFQKCPSWTWQQLQRCEHSRSRWGEMWVKVRNKIMCITWSTVWQAVHKIEPRFSKSVHLKCSRTARASPDCKQSAKQNVKLPGWTDYEERVRLLRKQNTCMKESLNRVLWLLVLVQL